jgi:hypothetical protein
MKMVHITNSIDKVQEVHLDLLLKLVLNWLSWVSIK